jgi:hypothetical protein
MLLHVLHHWVDHLSNPIAILAQFFYYYSRLDFKNVIIFVDALQDRHGYIVSPGSQQPTQSQSQRQVDIVRLLESNRVRYRNSKVSVSPRTSPQSLSSGQKSNTFLFVSSPINPDTNLCSHVSEKDLDLVHNTFIKGWSCFKNALDKIDSSAVKTDAMMTTATDTAATATAVLVNDATDSQANNISLLADTFVNSVFPNSRRIARTRKIAGYRPSDSTSSTDVGGSSSSIASSSSTSTHPLPIESMGAILQQTEFMLSGLQPHSQWNMNMDVTLQPVEHSSSSSSSLYHSHSHLNIAAGGGGGVGGLAVTTNSHMHLNPEMIAGMIVEILHKSSPQLVGDIGKQLQDLSGIPSESVKPLPLPSYSSPVVTFFFSVSYTHHHTSVSLSLTPTLSPPRPVK